VEDDGAGANRRADAESLNKGNGSNPEKDDLRAEEVESGTLPDTRGAIRAGGRIGVIVVMQENQE
jgi:hypothetical protein